MHERWHSGTGDCVAVCAIDRIALGRGLEPVSSTLKFDTCAYRTRARSHTRRRTSLSSALPRCGPTPPGSSTPQSNHPPRTLRVTDGLPRATETYRPDRLPYRPPFCARRTVRAVLLLHGPATPPSRQPPHAARLARSVLTRSVRTANVLGDVLCHQSEQIGNQRRRL